MRRVSYALGTCPVFARRADQGRDRLVTSTPRRPTVSRTAAAGRKPARPGAEEWVPARADVEKLSQAVHDCRGCELWGPATQAVFSSGPDDARLMLVGEQPGDREDREGEPFVGPAGRVLAEALEAAGLDPEQVYLTNAVKHFRFTERGKRRLHKKPDVAHVRACMPWLEAELSAVRPRVVVALGATAARAVLGHEVRIGAERGQVLDGEAHDIVVTTHPSALLRLRDRSTYGEALDALVADLRTAAEAAAR
ncbi:UdgX family uracil-DNA binding protein [Promicromonospora umidemergens]